MAKRSSGVASRAIRPRIRVSFRRWPAAWRVRRAAAAAMDRAKLLRLLELAEWMQRINVLWVYRIELVRQQRAVAELELIDLRRRRVLIFERPIQAEQELAELKGWRIQAEQELAELRRRS